MAGRDTGTVKVSLPLTPKNRVASLIESQKWNEKGYGFIERDGMGDR